MEKITRKTMLSEILNINPEAIETLFEIGMHCIGCPASAMETLEEGCMAHGLSEDEIEELIKRLN